MILKEVLKDMLLPVIGFNYRKDYYRWKAKYAKRLLKYKDLHKGEDCFIIGGGPSLKHMDLDVLKNYHTFALNRANLLFDLFDIEFSYHVCVDDMVLKNIKEDIDQNVFKCTSFVPQGTLNPDFLDQPHIERLFLGGDWTFHKDIAKQIHTGNTVTYVAMQIAYYMGFDRVFLIGVDHNWSNPGKAHSKSVLKTEDVNHFHPDYFKNKEWKAPDIKGNEISYALADYFYLLDNREIYDATVDGKLQVFPKIEFEDALHKAKKK
jgi:hypothetical protein